MVASNGAMSSAGLISVVCLMVVVLGVVVVEVLVLVVEVFFVCGVVVVTFFVVVDGTEVVVVRFVVVVVVRTVTGSVAISSSGVVAKIIIDVFKLLNGPDPTKRLTLGTNGSIIGTTCVDILTSIETVTFFDAGTIVRRYNICRITQ